MSSLYIVHKKKGNPYFSHLILEEFEDAFPKDIPRLPPRKDVVFTINLAPEEAPISREPYRMSAPELVELKM